MKRTLDTTNMEQDEFAGVEHEGGPGKWVCIGKAWNRSEGWMKSTKVLEVPGAGCFLQVTTREKSGVAEAVCWAPGVKLSGDKGILEADYGQEDVEDELAGFRFDVTTVADMVTIHAVYCGTVIENVSLSRLELRQYDDERLLDALKPFLDSVQNILKVGHDVEADKEALVKLLLSAVDSMR